VDVVLSRSLDLSRARVQKLIEGGRLAVRRAAGADAEVLTRKAEPVEAGWTLELSVPPPEGVHMEPQALPLTIVYQDADLVVVDKAAGMVVHPAPGHRDGTLVNALLHHVDDLSGVGGRLRPGIVHRLDRDTSGLLVVAKTDRAHRALADALRRREIKRLYLAAVWGHLSASPLTIDAPLGRDPHDRKRMTVREDGRPAVTRVRVRERWRAAELLDVALQTGRTHQIRVHLAHIGHPVVGDEVYGAGWGRGMGGDARGWARELARRVPRQFLHAAELAFTHPVSGEDMRFESPLPGDLMGPATWARGPDAAP
jgi:23S rRNA pseudouridine1911/1915/1917 synthase